MSAEIHVDTATPGNLLNYLFCDMANDSLRSIYLWWS